MALGIFTVITGTIIPFYALAENTAIRLFTKGAQILEFEKLREICGDYQQLNYAKGISNVQLHAHILTLL